MNPTSSSQESASGIDYARLARETAEYNRCASAAVTITDAHVIEQNDGQGNGMWLRLTRSVEDIDNDAKRSYDYTIPISSKSEDSNIFPPPPTEVSPNIQAKLRSPSGQKMAILRVDNNKDNNNRSPARQVLEIWEGDSMSSLIRRIALPTNEIHGKVIVDAATFGRPCWSPDETVMVYAAERKRPDTTSFFDPKVLKPQQKQDGTRTSIPGGQHTLGLGKSENWGEQMFSNEPLFDLFLVNVETGRIARLENVPGRDSSSTTSIGSYALGQCVFAPDGQSLVYTGWDAGGGSGMPKRLGLIYCIQRPSKLYSSAITKLLERIQKPIDYKDDDDKKGDDPDFVCLTPSHQMAKSPRFAPCNDQGTSRLVYLASEKGFDTHFGHLALHGMDWKTDTGFDTAGETVLVKQIWNIRDEEASKDEGVVEQISFPGLCPPGQLPEQCFVSRDILVASTIWGSSVQTVRINVQDGAVRLVRACTIDGSDNHLTSQDVMCICSDGIVVKESTVNNPAVVLYIPNEELLKPNLVAEGALATVVASFAPFASSTCSPVSATAEPLCDYTYQVLTLERPAEDGNKWSAPIQCILMLPNQKEGDPKPPLICMPHGGPHSVSAADFLSTWPFFCGGESKYALLLVNYRGSVGFGQAAVEDLPSRIADLDVGDVVHAVKHVAASGLVNPAKLGICGGSHGGFLTSHLIGQFPDLFKAACMRNPVTNIASMISSTDIPDWCVIEACGLGTYDWGKFTGPSAEQLTEMYQKSPIAHVQNVTVPTLIALGMKDLRVPPSQGLEYYHILRSQGVATKLLLYDDCDHPIAGVASKADQWINVKRWFDEHMQ